MNQKLTVSKKAWNLHICIYTYTKFCVLNHYLYSFGSLEISWLHIRKPTESFLSNVLMPWNKDVLWQKFPLHKYLLFLWNEKKNTHLVSMKQCYSLRSGWITREEWVKKEEITLPLSLSSPGAMKAKVSLAQKDKIKYNVFFI